MMSHNAVTSHSHMITCYTEEYRRFQNNNVILHVNGM